MGAPTWNDDASEERQQRKGKKTEAHETAFRMWEEGIRDLNEIGSETGYSAVYVRHLLAKRGYTTTTTNTKTADQIQDVCDDYISEMPIRDLLKKHNISNNVLYAMLDEKGIPIRLKNEMRKANRQKMFDVAVQMYQENEPLKEIIAATGFSATAIYQELSNRNIDTRRQPGTQDAALEQAVTLYGEKLPLADIQNETGVSPTRLYRELAIRDVPIRRGTDLDARMDLAVQMYQEDKLGDEIYRATRVNSTMLYRALRRRGIAKHAKSHREAQGVDVSLALKLYDEGVAFPEIRKLARINATEMISELKKRGKDLRTGLSLRGGAKNMDYAVTAYNAGVNLETIEVDTGVTRVRLYAELNKREIELRP